MIARNRSERFPTELQPETEILGAGGDLVDLFFNYVSAISPGFADDVENKNVNLDEVKRAMRCEFGGAREYVRSAKNDNARAVAKEALELLKGASVKDVAKQLGLSRSTIYRYIQQAGG